MSYDPAIVGYYGKLVETWAAERYPIELDYPEVGGLKFDSTDEDDTRPWDVKGSMTNGVRLTFNFWENQHRARSRRRRLCACVVPGAGMKDYRHVVPCAIRARAFEIGKPDESRSDALSEPQSGGADSSNRAQAMTALCC